MAGVVLVLLLGLKHRLLRVELGVLHDAVRFVFGVAQNAFRLAVRGSFLVFPDEEKDEECDAGANDERGRGDANGNSEFY